MGEGEGAKAVVKVSGHVLGQLITQPFFSDHLGERQSNSW